MISNVFMFINYSIKPIPYFINKKTQFIALFERLFMPFLLFFNPRTYLIGVFLCLIITRFLDAIFNNKKYLQKSFEKLKYYAYLTGILIMIMTIGFVVLIQKLTNQKNSVEIISYLVSSIIIVFYIAILGFEIFEIFYDNYL